MFYILSASGLQGIWGAPNGDWSSSWGTFLTGSQRRLCYPYQGACTHDFGKTTACCGQAFSGDDSHQIYQCPPSHPKCMSYRSDVGPNGFGVCFAVNNGVLMGDGPLPCATSYGQCDTPTWEHWSCCPKEFPSCWKGASGFMYADQLFGFCG